MTQQSSTVADDEKVLPKPFIHCRRRGARRQPNDGGSSTRSRDSARASSALVTQPVASPKHGLGAHGFANPGLGPHGFVDSGFQRSGFEEARAGDSS